MKNSAKMLCLLALLLFPCLALAIERDAYESDDNINQAKPIASPQSHNFHSADDQDWVKFDAFAGGIYTVMADNVGAGCAVSLELYNSDQHIEVPKKIGKIGREIYFEWSCTLTGTYFVKASFAGTFTDTGTEYSLSVKNNSGIPDGCFNLSVTDACNGQGIGQIAILLDERNDNFLINSLPVVGDYRVKIATSGKHSLKIVLPGYISPSPLEISVGAYIIEELLCSTKIPPVSLERINGSRSGVITDVSNGQGIKGATILLNGNVAATTGDGGLYSITTPQGTYTATVQATGYQSVSAPVTIRCDISNANLTLTPVKIYYKDADNDGYSDGTSITSTTKPDGYKLPNELIAISGDCNDNDPNIHPGAPEICDGKDNNCNNQIDEGFPLYTYYCDADGDGYGDPSNSIQSCSPTPSADYVKNKNDCNDNDSYNKGLISVSIINKCSEEGEKVSGVKITVSGNGKTETIAANGGYSLSFVPNVSYTVTFEAAGYEKVEYPEFKVNPCDNLPANICLTKTDLSYVITVLRVLSGIDIKLPECINSQVDMSQAIRVLQEISGLRK